MDWLLVVPRAPVVLAALLMLPAAHAGPADAGDMRPVPGGVAQIGSERGRADERPPFHVQVAAFALDATPVTVAAFARYVERTGHRTDAERLGSGAVMTFGTGTWRLVAGANWRRPLGPQGEAASADHPVTQVSWNDAQAYCAAQGRRLPTEIEFEHAARLGGAADIRPASAGAGTSAGTSTRPGQGSGAQRWRANVWTGVFPLLNTAADGWRTTSPVTAFPPDALGLHDMAGNVWEWTSDWYRPYAQRNEPAPAGGAGERVQRGGSFLCDTSVCYGFRPTARNHATPESAHMHVGFRCAADAPAHAAEHVALTSGAGGSP